MGWYESGLRPESRAPHPTAYRPKQVQKEYIRTDIEKALNSPEIAGFDEFCLAPNTNGRKTGFFGGKDLAKVVGK